MLRIGRFMQDVTTRCSAPHVRRGLGGRGR
jgi:hypothetical protein